MAGELDDVAAKVAEVQAAIDGLHGHDVNIGADVTGAAAALGEEAAAANVAAGALDRHGTAAMWAATGTGFFATALAATHLLVGAFGANVLADAVGITAFGVAATKAIGPVVTSLSTLTTSYGQLDNYQKAAALSLQSLLNSMGGNEAQVFTVFNQGLALIESHMGAAGGVTSQASIAFMDFFAMLKEQFASTGWVDLFSRSTGVIRADLDALFGLFNNILGVIPGLFHDFNGLGLGLIGFAGGVLHTTAAVLNLDPALTRAAGEVALFATAWHLAGKNISWVPAMGPTLGKLATDMKAVYAGARIAGAGIAEAGLTAAGALGPLVELGAGAVAFVAIANALPDPVNGFVNALARQDQAMGTNVTGYARLSASLNDYLTHAKQLPSSMSPRDFVGIAQAQLQASATSKTLAGNFSYLSSALGMTRNQAIAAAAATGVNLRQSLTGSSQAAAMARDKMTQYASTLGTAAAVEKQFTYDMAQANDTSLNMTARLQGLTTAFSVLSGPLLQSIAAGGQFKQTLGGLAQAARAANDVVGTATQRQAALSIALATAASAAFKDSVAILNNTHSTAAAVGPLIQMKDQILDLGLKGQAAAALVGQLNREIAAMHSKSISLTTYFRQVYTVSGSNLSAMATLNPGYQAGTMAAARGLALVGETGPELVAFAGGERVLNNADTRRFMNSPAGSFGHPMPGLGGPGGGQIEAVIHNNVTLDGEVVWRNMQRRTLQYNVRQGNAQSGAWAPNRA